MLDPGSSADPAVWSFKFPPCGDEGRALLSGTSETWREDISAEGRDNLLGRATNPVLDSLRL